MVGRIIQYLCLWTSRDVHKLARTTPSWKKEVEGLYLNSSMADRDFLCFLCEWTLHICLWSCFVQKNWGINRQISLSSEHAFCDSFLMFITALRAWNIFLWTWASIFSIYCLFLSVTVVWMCTVMLWCLTVLAFGYLFLYLLSFLNLEFGSIYPLGKLGNGIRICKYNSNVSFKFLKF